MFFCSNMSNRSWSFLVISVCTACQVLGFSTTLPKKIQSIKQWGLYFCTADGAIYGFSYDCFIYPLFCLVLLIFCYWCLQYQKTLMNLHSKTEILKQLHSRCFYNLGMCCFVGRIKSISYFTAEERELLIKGQKGETVNFCLWTLEQKCQDDSTDRFIILHLPTLYRTRHSSFPANEKLPSSVVTSLKSADGWQEIIRACNW